MCENRCTGQTDFGEDPYAYVGPTQSNLEKLIERHLGRKEHQLWHIDYLLDNEATKILKVFQKEAEKAKECEIVKQISEGRMPIEGFGSSDCKCSSHPIRIEDYKFLRRLMHE